MERVLLVVDDDEDIGKLLRLTLKKHFAEIRVAKSAAEAEGALRAGAVSHVVCDYYLGPTEPAGMTLLARWRGEYPGIRYAALFSGSTLADLEPAPLIDDVFAKPRGFHALVDKLSREDRRVAEAL